MTYTHRSAMHSEYDFIYIIEHEMPSKKVWGVSFSWSFLEVVEEENILDTSIRSPCFSEPQLKMVAREAWGQLNVDN